MDELKLKRHLFDAYGGFADKRIKKLNSGSRFVVDDRGPNDHAADKSLYSWFCSVCVEVHSGDRIDVILGGEVPTSAAVETWFSSHGVVPPEPGRTSRMIAVPLAHTDWLNELALLIDGIVKGGARYSVKGYKYSCPRTADALRKLAKHMRALHT